MQQNIWSHIYLPQNVFKLPVSSQREILKKSDTDKTGAVATNHCILSYYSCYLCALKGLLSFGKHLCISVWVHYVRASHFSIYLKKKKLKCLHICVVCLFLVPPILKVKVCGINAFFLYYLLCADVNNLKSREFQSLTLLDYDACIYGGDFVWQQ